MGLLTFSACSSGTQSKENKKTSDSISTVADQPETKPKPHFSTGKIIDTVVCQSDSSLFYALYLPSDYTTAKKWPVIYFFDPHGAGKLPLTKYQQLAATYHFILVGFYNSHNGLDFNLINRRVQTLLNDTYQNLSIDANRIYTAGFSGGAKVAGLIAGYDGNIAGVIACGAGLPQVNQPLQYQFNYIGIAGLTDFNYTGLEAQDEQLEKAHFRHQLLTFDGKHERPPKTTMQLAFDWLQVNAMKTNLIPKNDSLLKAIKAGFEKKITRYRKEKDTYKRYLACKAMCNYLEGLADVKMYEKELDSLSNTVEIQHAEKQKTMFAQKEMQLKQKYMHDLATKSEDWWKSEVPQLHALIRKSKTKDEAFMYKRVLSFLSLAGYMQASNALKQKNAEAAQRFIYIFTMVDPKNPDHSYLSACLDAQNGNKPRFLEDLRQAVKLGFDDYNRLKQDNDLTPFKSDKEYKKIIKSMHKNIK